MGIVGRHGGGIFLWLLRRDLFVGTDQGLISWRSDGVYWWSQSWVLLPSAEIMKGKIIETWNEIG